MLRKGKGQTGGSSKLCFTAQLLNECVGEEDAGEASAVRGYCIHTSQHEKLFQSSMCFRETVPSFHTRWVILKSISEGDGEFANSGSSSLSERSQITRERY